MERLKIAIVPAGGAFGTALSVPLCAQGHEVTFVFRDEGKARTFGEIRQVDRLPGIKLPKNIRFTADAEETVKSSDLVVVAAPTNFLQSTYVEHVMPFRRNETKILSVPKGLIEIGGRYLRPSEVISMLDSEAARHLIVLSGPNFADEIAQGLPFVSVAASKETALAEFIVHVFGARSRSRIYPSNDVAGVESGGAFKNVYAIAAGVSDGCGYGENARAALIIRGEEEMVRLGIALGGHEETLRGAAGSADLWLTCVSKKSRNHEYGKRISHGEDPQEVLDEFLQNGRTVEGFGTTKVVWELAREYGVKTPIIDAVYSVLYSKCSIANAISELLDREPVYENGKPLVSVSTVR